MGPAIIFVPDANRPGVFDATGAFWPEAERFCTVHHLDMASSALVKFPSTKRQMIERREPVLRAISKAVVPWQTVAFFCHGYKDGFQAGFAKADLPVLSQTLAKSAAIDAYVLLYACDAGRNADDARIDDTQPGPGGDGGFADLLRDALEALGRRVTVLGHTTAGHCTINPHARRFAPGTGGQGGQWYVEPQSPVWGRWVRQLREPTSTLRFRYPRMTSAAIAEELMLRVV